jgi:tetratricopeptide (TPR) repeat protein
MKHADRAFLCLAFALLTVMQYHRLLAQAPANDPLASADAVYTARNWTAAENLYLSLAKENPDNARYWYRLGVSQRGAGHFHAALESLEKARTLGAGKGLPGSLVDYELGTTYAAMGDSARAIKSLKDAADGGFLQPDRVQNDAEWNRLRDDPQFIALAKEVKHNAAPCEDAQFRQFDFWIGDWDVTSTADGVSRGSSHISSEMGGCVIWENWTSAGNGYFGKSYNTYNLNLHRWEQYWVDNSAGTIFFYGNLKDGVMDYWTDDVPQSNGQKLRRHLQFFNLGPGKVRQFSQGSSDGGKTWQVEYDLTYNRRADKSAGTR